MATSSNSSNRLHINRKAIPQRLRDLDQWLVWRYEDNPDPTKKQLKVPYYCSGWRRSGKLGAAKDVERLASFDEAYKVATEDGYSGVGLAVLDTDDLTIIDLDNCISDTGEYSEFATRLIDSGSYTERSPSGRGLRAVFEGKLISGKRNFHIKEGDRVEVYCGNAYTTFTGRREGGAGVDVADLPSSLARTLRGGMISEGIDPYAGPEVATDEDDDGPLASMDARPLPNMTTAQAARVLEALPERWGSEGEGTWYKVAAALHLQFNGSEDGYEILDNWSRERSGYDEVNNRKRWAVGFAHDSGKQTITTMRNLVFEARDAGAKFKRSTLESWGLRREAQKHAAKEDISLPTEDDDASDRAWQPISAETLDADERPEGARPLVRNWMYEGTVALFSSNGGGGKSYSSLSFCLQAAIGGQWFGEHVEQGRVLYISGEDPLNEVAHRMWGLRRAYGVGPDGLTVGGVSQFDIADITGILHKALYSAGEDYGKTEFTGQFERFRALVRAGGYRYVVLDNVSKFYMANENARAVVDEFISGLVVVAAEQRCGILLVGHDSKAGMAASGGGAYSGSTAWNNSVRSRWSLSTKDGVRTLVVEKNNYGRAGHGGTFVWDDAAACLRMGAPIVDSGTLGALVDDEVREGVLAAVLELYAQGQWTTGAGTGRMGAITEHPFVLDQQLKAKDLREMMHQMVVNGDLIEEHYRDSGRREKVRFAPSI